jgi:DeoR family ulaG and ulaABCDEF operon transcriptional repressor
MLEAERQRLILKLLQERSVVGVGQLVEILGASEATVRRDINALAEGGRLRRIRGGAESLTPHHEAHLVGVPFELSLGLAAREKSAIGRAAVALVSDGESILINGGTTTYAFAEALAESGSDRQIDILTNSVPILTKLLSGSRYRITLAGGTVYREQNMVLSPHDDEAIEHFWGQKLFTGCYGLNRFGVMETDPLIAQAQAKLLKRAEELVVLADSRKLRQHSSMIVADIKRVTAVITDSGASEKELEFLHRAGVNVIRVDVTREEREAEAIRRRAPV